MSMFGRRSACRLVVDSFGGSRDDVMIRFVDTWIGLPSSDPSDGARGDLNPALFMTS